MLRVGLTGELGSGKSTVARMLAARGAIVLSSDEMGRAMMEPGQEVYAQIVRSFGVAVVAADGRLDRRKLAALAFDEIHPRIATLNAIVHPAVLAEQERQLTAIAKVHPAAIVVIESALIFSVAGWQSRFDRIVVVAAPEEQKIARYIARTPSGERTALEQDARSRLALQRTSPPADALIICNDQGLEELETQVDAAWRSLVPIEE